MAQTLGGSTVSPLPSVPVPARASTPVALALEGTLDPDAYLVGPGDVFTISVGGAVPRQTQTVVSADGRLIVPEAGSFVVGGRTLREVNEQVRSALQRRFVNLPTDVALVQPRQFYVHVSGAVAEPGRKLVSGTARVEDAITAAVGPGQTPRGLARYEQPDVETPTLEARRGQLRWPALRNVRVVHQSGSESSVDLLRYFNTGDVQSNPYLQDGDAVVVPSFDPVREGVFVGGAVDRPGIYDVRPDDNALALLEGAGLGIGRALAGVRVVRGGQPFREGPLTEALGLPVGAGDQVFAVPANPRAGTARAVGAVRYEGVYPITSGETTLADLLRMAGGLRDDALPRGAYVERPLPAEPGDPTPPRLSGFDLVGTRFLQDEFARTPRLSVDLSATLDGSAEIVLVNGDVLTVPSNVGGVRVFGQVARPGYVPFEAGRTAAEYIAASGGTGPTATEVFVVEAGSGRLILGRDRTVGEGDAVFVDRLAAADTPEIEPFVMQRQQIEREDRRERRQLTFQLVTTTLSVVGTLATVLLAYNALSSNG